MKIIKKHITIPKPLNDDLDLVMENKTMIKPID